MDVLWEILVLLQANLLVRISVVAHFGEYLGLEAGPLVNQYLFCYPHPAEEQEQLPDRGKGRRSAECGPRKSILEELALVLPGSKLSETAFPGLRKEALCILTMFGSTDSCEAALPTMNIIKTQYRSRLTMSSYTCA
ncbi:hypothetical protein N1851_015153 [Merluccius polli]|uniref:Uncharacterized protein n=1 Tax=Merluccius polli TaxID=89951 RepID=A0AA47MSR5_MERPO|nr:hypothetical protein N1851_015153 [Merluccius polli]